MFEKLKKKGFQILALHHAEAILKHDMGTAVKELEEMLLNISIPVEELVLGGGGEGKLTQRMRRVLAERRTDGGSISLKSRKPSMAWRRNPLPMRSIM